MSQSDKGELLDMLAAMAKVPGLEGLVEQVRKTIALAERTAEALDAGAFRSFPGHPARLTKEQVMVNPPVFNEIHRAAGRISEEVTEEPFLIASKIFEYISRPDGRLLVVYPMLAKPDELDLDSDVVELQWVGDIVAGIVNPEDWIILPSLWGTVMAAYGGDIEA